MIADAFLHLNLLQNYSPFSVRFYAISYLLEICIPYYFSHHSDIVPRVGLSVKWDVPTAGIVTRVIASPSAEGRGNLNALPPRSPRRPFPEGLPAMTEKTG